ncbi:uncharacterized protein LOC125726839 isoform X2 [Brienomyrus brachyistius]|uniref:uncharacterized protein LOC125726839 isoform X2 n=1 Tax=Brienomyrus brachyistius TaxID=42636 RepID=UPI0020B2D4E5|nr:uncharacterized protein LOC125726839 isoform X2 [Brienomyrus brachyistius]
MQTPYTRNSSEDLSTRARGVRRQCKLSFLLFPLLSFSLHIMKKEGINNEKRSSLVQLALYVGLSLLVLLLVIIITWKVRDKHKKNVAGGQNLGRTTYSDVLGQHEVSDARKKAILIHCLGTEGRQIFRTLGPAEMYEDAVSLLGSHFAAPQSVILWQILFRRRRQQPATFVRTI